MGHLTTKRFPVCVMNSMYKIYNIYIYIVVLFSPVLVLKVCILAGCHGTNLRGYEQAFRQRSSSICVICTIKCISMIISSI